MTCSSSRNVETKDKEGDQNKNQQNNPTVNDGSVRSNKIILDDENKGKYTVSKIDVENINDSNEGEINQTPEAETIQKKVAKKKKPLNKLNKMNSKKSTKLLMM